MKHKQTKSNITMVMRALPADGGSTLDNFKTTVLDNNVFIEPIMYDTLRSSIDKLRAYLEVKGLEIDELRVTTRAITKTTKRSK